MNDVVISARGLGKRYLIGHQSVDRNQSFRERIMAGAGGLARNLAKTARGEQLVQGEVEEFWALKDVDFDIRRGDTVGIIGRNGAGKSTLLKILSRITEPTTGRVDIRGRVASLLEVGTGFHPELTGRENIFLNGAILGMSRAEIRRKLDEIIDFAGVEKFLDTPVKRYSSGMYVRLAFAVAAHLEPEILIVDEVLAVGDAEFQKKCLDKMENLAGSGRTVFFVSHNMSAVSYLCTLGILMEHGTIKQTGQVSKVVAAMTLGGRSDERVNGASEAFGAGAVERIGLVLTGGQAGPASGEAAMFDLTITAREIVPEAGCEIAVYAADGRPLFQTKTRPTWNVPLNLRVGENRVRCVVPELPLVPGDYTVGIAVTVPNIQYLYETPAFCTLRVGRPSAPNPRVHFPTQFPLWPQHKWLSDLPAEPKAVAS